METMKREKERMLRKSSSEFGMFNEVPFRLLLQEKFGIVEPICQSKCVGRKDGIPKK